MMQISSDFEDENSLVQKELQEINKCQIQFIMANESTEEWQLT